MTTTKGTDMITIRVPNNYIDNCADASLSDTLGWLEEHGTHYRKVKDDARNAAWHEAAHAMTERATRSKHFTEFTVSVLAAQVVADDLNYFATRPLGDYDPYDRPNMRRYAQQCAKARTRILDQIAGA